jgi:quercetin dioxygenase-like cupin family protein
MKVVDFTTRPPGEKSVQFESVEETDGCQILKVVLKAGAVLAKHTAPVAVSVLVIYGAGIMEVAAETVVLKQGTMVSFPAMTPHEARAESDMTLLVLKYPASS